MCAERLAAVLAVVVVMAPSPCRQRSPSASFQPAACGRPFRKSPREFERREGVRVDAQFGASGLLRDEIAGGAKADVFASANMDHPRSLAQSGNAVPVVLFARNRMCALARPGFDATTSTLVDRMLDPIVTVGTSTPNADPSGDYAWEVFRKIDAERPGSFAILSGKARQLTGGPTSPRLRRIEASTAPSWNEAKPTSF